MKNIIIITLNLLLCWQLFSHGQVYANKQTVANNQAVLIDGAYTLTAENGNNTNLTKYVIISTC
ncbi:MAG: hypothetical protein JKY81_10995 [Colwellia sp.]|nr:hypothetical protein [Colwellia sp.]